jgi:rhodanese-related sulfurtransferase
MNITVKELQESIRTGRKPAMIDVRTPAEHGEIHIEGSHLMPLDRLDATAVKALATDVDGCVLICRSGKRATNALEKLASAGCENLQVLEGGVTAWDAAGLPVKRGAKAMSLERQVRIGAGAMVLIGVILGSQVHGAFYGLSAFVGAGLMFAGITDWCGMAMVLAKMPWNQRAGVKCTDNSCSV